VKKGSFANRENGKDPDASLSCFVKAVESRVRAKSGCHVDLNEDVLRKKKSIFTRFKRCV
jgi:hypothetical protein